MNGSKNTRPFLSIWFGNFFEPFYSDFEALRKGIADIASLGFNSINLDSKAWEDFFARYRGEPASRYVAGQEFMMSEILKLGLDYTHLALYLCGDNLYPEIRDASPVRGEETIRTNGQPMGTYKYWSPRAQETMVTHVRGLLKLYGKGMRRTPDGRIIVQTMFEPIPRPSFDDEGRRKYLGWLQERYAADIGKINQRYELAAKSFDELQPSEYWLRPEELSWVGCARPNIDDFDKRTPDFYRWIDNQTFLAKVLDEYLATMAGHWQTLEERIFVEPVLHQWGYFFNPPGQPDWQTGQRALDVYRCAKHVDSVLYIAAPLNAENRPDALALSLEGSILRNANSHRPFTAGLYLGRHINGDIYSVVPPAEAIATLIANGASGFHVYGYSGLDDGGVMARMDEVFRESLRMGNRWAAEVIPMLDSPRAREVALLFPAEMSLYEPLEVDVEGRHRMDLLGWYQQFTDLGWHVDILHPDHVSAGGLAGYRHLIVPANSLYDLGDNTALERAILEFVESGGSLFHGPHCELAKRALGIEEGSVDFDCIAWDEEIIPHGWSTVALRSGAPVARYIQSGEPAIAHIRRAKGHVYSFGFQYGYSYSRRTMPIVPRRYGRREIHPVVLLNQTPVAQFAGTSPLCPMTPVKGVEFCRFGNELVVVNHRSSPVNISPIECRKSIPLVPCASDWLPGHSAICLSVP